MDTFYDKLDAEITPACNWECRLNFPVNVDGDTVDL